MRCTSLVIGLFIAIASTLYAQDTTTQSEPVEEKFAIHGYLTQAYTESSDLPILGITTTGSAEYRLLVLQTRYKLSDESEVVVQMRHRHFGESPLTAIEPEFALSWAYYQQNVGPVRLRVGRIPFEQGIYSETRFVGTLVPFLRAPVSEYPEGIEFMDGGAVAYRTPTIAGWSVDAAVSVGSSFYQDVIPTPFGPVTPRYDFYINHVEQIWLNTPLTGLRLGGNLDTFYNKDSTTSNSQRNQIWKVSLDGVFDRYFVRAEHDELDIPTGSLDSGVRHYIQTGVNPISNLWLNYQYEFQHFDVITAFGNVVTFNRDRAVGLGYAFTPNLCIKAERHLASGNTGFDQYMAAPGRTYYNIASMSVSF